MQNSYTVINASAGSGKTYSLVQRVLMICLRYPNQADAIRHILALTFTNKAANEMKERILQNLGEFVKDNYLENNDLKNIQIALSEKGYKIDLEELHKRSQKVLDYILHHYSTLNIGTIDKFNSRLVKSFSYELGLAQNFNLEIQAEPYLIEAVDEMLNDIGEDKQISDTFIDFVNYSLDNNERVNLNQNLYNSAKQFVNDVHHKNLESNKDFEWSIYETKKEQLRENIKQNRSDAENLTKKALDLIQNHNLEIEDFAQGKNGLGGFFQKALEFYQKRRDSFPFPSNEDSALNNFQKGSAAKSKHKQNDILEILPQLISWRENIIYWFIDSQKKEKILRAILPLKVNAEIQKKLSEIEEENDLVLLSKFNILINENLKNEPSAFIYEKVGTQFQHYFFDEFQDTSSMQWENFLPLRDHSITSENTSFTIVGDPKQSIYRFRGGESQLMLDIINRNEITPKFAEAENLEHNWRSAKNIVDFNNRLYDFMSKDLNEEHQKIFGENAFQNAKSDLEGRVRINLMENSTKTIFYEDSAEKMRNDIQDCVNNGFLLSDITILCRGNTDIFNYSQKLGNLEIDYKGAKTHIKTISEKGLTLDLSYTIKSIIEFLKWQTNQNNRQFLVKMIYNLKTLGRISISNFTKDILEVLKLKTKKEIDDFLLSKYNLNLQNGNPNLNLYNYIEYYLQEFSVEGKETDFLLNFLEMLYNYTQNTGATIKDFLKYWEEDASNISIQASENVDAVQIMTIHKAKGLEFPVVMIPMRNENKDKRFSEWLSLDDNDELKTVIIEQFPDNLTVYDQEMDQFNKTNSYKNKIDRFCIQYVATTRAVEQLFFYIEKPSKFSNNLEIYDFAKQNQSVEDSENDSFDLYTTNETILKKQRHKKSKNLSTKSISSISNIQDPNKIEIATPSQNYQNKVEHVRLGIFTHEILSKIESEKDLKNVLQSYLLEGLINKEEKDNILIKIENIISDPRFSDYFAPDLEIINERDMFSEEDGILKTYRPDRIIKKGEKYMIIDFKTGEENEKHQKQIDLYKKILEKFGKIVTKTEIIYIS